MITEKKCKICDLELSSLESRSTISDYLGANEIFFPVQTFLEIEEYYCHNCKFNTCYSYDKEVMNTYILPKNFVGFNYIGFNYFIDKQMACLFNNEGILEILNKTLNNGQDFKYFLEKIKTYYIFS